MIVKDNQIVVYTSIVGDHFHVGHLNLLRRSCSLGTMLIVGVIDDECVKSYKGRYPIFSLRERIEIISSISFVDMAVPQYERDGYENIKSLDKVDIVTRGDDAILENEKQYIESIAGKYVLLPRTPSISTTDIINAIKSTLMNPLSV